MDAWRPDSALVARRAASPNHGERAAGVGLDAIVLHYTGMADGPSALTWLCTPASEVSCHYLVEEDGAVVQLVPERRRAWHAGRSCWHALTDLNSASIGIEIVNGGHDFGLPPFPDRQVGAVAALCRDIAARHAIPPERVLAHSDIAPGRKRDPGERFPWAALFEAGVGLWVPERSAEGPRLGLGDTGPAVETYRRTLAALGYGVGPEGGYDDRVRSVTEAFQRRFRPSRVDGLADAGTLATLADLTARLAARSLPPAGA